MQPTHSRVAANDWASTRWCSGTERRRGLQKKRTRGCSFVTKANPQRRSCLLHRRMAKRPRSSGGSSEQVPLQSLKRWHALVASCCHRRLLHRFERHSQARCWSPEAPLQHSVEDELEGALEQARSSTSGESECINTYESPNNCAVWASAGECENNAVFMLTQCAKACGCREPPPEAAAAIAAAKRASTAGDEPACVDRDKTGACAHWAASGECEANPAFMKLKCAASCNTCDILDYKKRCPMPADRVPAVQAGDISTTFERALSEYQSLGPKVLSRDPWVMSFDNFLSDEEVEAVVKHGEGRFERSTASGGRKTSSSRSRATSAPRGRPGAYKRCLEDPIVKRIYNRVSNVTRAGGQL